MKYLITAIIVMFAAIAHAFGGYLSPGLTNYSPGASGQTMAGGKSQGAEFGLRHFF